MYILDVLRELSWIIMYDTIMQNYYANFDEALNAHHAPGVNPHYICGLETCLKSLMQAREVLRLV